MISPADTSKQIRRLDKENRYLKRQLERLQTQLHRQEKIDEMNRFQGKRANSRLEVARAIAERSNRAKSEFLANMSHEIRTPLNIVLGMVEVLESTDLDSAQHQYLSSLRLSGEHLLKLLNDILEFSRIESGSVELEQEPFHLSQLVTDIEEMARHLVKKKNISFELDFQANLEDGRLGDIGKIKQILINLLNNSVKFTESGTISLKIREIDSENSSYLSFIVTDTGAGIPDDQQDLIFQRFTQIARSGTDKSTGVGLGLAISQRLAMAMGGSIDFHSRLDKGTSFEVRVPLPVIELPSAARDSAPDQRSIDPRQLPSLSILAVDDISLNLDIIRHFLMQSAVTADFADNGRQAVELRKKKNYDVILMDIRMPTLDGLEAARIIRNWENNHSLAAIPIIAMTAHAFREQRKSFLEAGFDDVLTKPFSKTALYRTLLSASNNEPLALKTEFTGNKSIGLALEESHTDCALPAELLRLMPQLLENLTSSLAALEKAVSLRSITEAASICHSMKGVAGMYGFRKLSSLIENLERCCHNRDMHSVKALISSLDFYIAEIKETTGSLWTVEE